MSPIFKKYFQNEVFEGTGWMTNRIKNIKSSCLMYMLRKDFGFRILGGGGGMDSLTLGGHSFDQDIIHIQFQLWVVVAVNIVKR